MSIEGKPPLLEDRVRALVAELARTEPAHVPAEAPWRALGLDSLDLVSLLVACEQEFGVEIPDMDAVNFHRVRDIVDFLARHVAAEALESP